MILAIDTSCYTTSVAYMDMEGNLLSDQRRVLEVPLGERGLSQSEALFQHIRNLPQLMQSLSQSVDLRGIKAVGVSTRPRPVEGSYMPVFLGGEQSAIIVASTLQVPLYSLSHQEGHMMAGIFSSEFRPAVGQKFFLVHFSGGTSEVILTEKCDQGKYHLKLYAYGNDLHAGQFVDRIGVLLGLTFPTGAALERLAASYQGEVPKIKTWAKGREFSFSGQETAIRRLLEQGLEHGAAARAVEETVARTMIKVLSRAMEETGVADILLVGGVMSNQFIADTLKRKLPQACLWFAKPKYASDNAVGIAALTLEQYLAESK